MRTLLIALLSGWRLNRCAPHSRQKHFSMPPPGGHQPCTSSSPCTNAIEPSSTKACADDDVPVRRWQRVQWQ